MRKFFLVITAAENLCTNSYMYEKINKQNLSEQMEIFEFLHVKKFFFCEKTWVSQVKKVLCWHKTLRGFIQKSTFSSLLLQLLLNYFKLSLIFCSVLTVGCIKWSRALDSLKMLLHFLKEICFSRLHTANHYPFFHLPWALVLV